MPQIPPQQANRASEPAARRSATREYAPAARTGHPIKPPSTLTRARVDIFPSSNPDRALSALNYELTPNCNLSQLHHERTPIACVHTTGNSNTNLSQVSYRNILRYKYPQVCNQCEHSHTHKCTRILILTNCFLMHHTSILLRVSQPCL
jgi:hypothetical protein